MNHRERVALLLLLVALVVGAAASAWQGWQRGRQRAAAFAPLAECAVVEEPAAPGPLDLNLATAAALEALPGIGPVLAARIIDYRERHGRFGSVAELREVAGIGPKRYAVLRGLVVVGPGTD